MTDPTRVLKAGEPAIAGQDEDQHELLGGKLASVAGRGAGPITNRLRQAIESGVFSDGDQLPPERQLAVALGTARSTIRKTLDQLEQLGLVVRRVGSGTFVSYSGPVQDTSAEVADLISPLQLIETRFSVEPYMARLAAIHANSRDLASFEDILAQLDSCGDDQEAFTRWDAAFHLQLARCSRNPLLLNIYQQINDVRARAQWNQVKRVVLTHSKIQLYNKQHRGIFDALSARNVNLAAELLQEHLSLAQQDLMGAEGSV